MTKQSTLAKIETLCQKANPNLLKLEFGCRVLITILRSKTLTRIIEEGSDGTFMLNYAPFWWSREQLQYDKKFKILGKEPGLADVLLAFQKEDIDMHINTLGQFLYLDSKHNLLPEIKIDWNLAKGLYGQSLETLIFLASLLETK